MVFLQKIKYTIFFAKPIQMKSFFYLILQVLIILVSIIVYRFFTEHETEERIQQSISKSLVENQSFLIKRELFIESIIRKEEIGSLWGTDKKALIITKGKVPYGIDMSLILPSDIMVSEEEKRIQIQLPHPKIYDVIVSDIYVYDVQTGLFSDTDQFLKKLYQSVYQDAKKTLKAEAKTQLNASIDHQIRDEFVLFLGQILGMQGLNYKIDVEFKTIENDSLLNNELKHD